MEIFMAEVQKVIDNEPRDHGVIILSAIDGMGKSKLMRAMKSRASRVGFRYIRCYIWYTISMYNICHESLKFESFCILKLKTFYMNIV